MERFAEDAADAGIDGVIIPDLPPGRGAAVSGDTGAKGDICNTADRADQH